MPDSVSEKIKKLVTKFALKEINKISEVTTLVNVCANAVETKCLPSDMFYRNGFELPCKVEYDAEERDIFRTDYILVPRDNIRQVGDTFGVKTDERVKTMDELRNEIVRGYTNKQYERIILSWGTEVFQIGGVDFLTCNEEFCKLCSRQCRLRSYIVSPLMAGLINASNIAVISLSYPCQHESISRILRGYSCDPPKIDVVFPKNLTISKK